MNGFRHPLRAPLSLLLLALLGASLSAPSQAATPSELQQFRSYPYIERAYRALDSQPAEAEKLVRHVLEEISPEHAEAQRILLQALQRQGRYAEALDVCAKLPAEQAAPLREELRLAWIASDQGVPAAILDGWLSEAAPVVAARLWQAQALHLERRDGVPAAQRWLAGLPSRLQDDAWRHWQASLAERQQDWPAVRASLAGQANLSAEDWQRLGQAYVELGQAEALERLLERAPSAEAAATLRVNAARRWVGQGRSAPAYRQLLALQAAGQLPADLRRSLFELARQQGDSVRADALAAELGEDCLERSAWLIKRDAAAARRVLASCAPAAQPQRWLAQVQQLRALELLPRADLPGELHDPLYIELSRAAGQGPQALTWLLAHPAGEARLARSATLAQQLGRRQQAAELWQRHYQASGSGRSLEQASYLWQQLGQPQRARDLLLKARRLDAAQGARLAQLSVEDEQLSAEQVERLLPRLAPGARGELLAALAARGRCPEVLQLSAEQPTSAAEWRARGQCHLQEQPGVAVEELRQGQALGDRPSADLLPFALAAAGEPEAALALWQQTPVAQQSAAVRRAVVGAEVAAGQLEQAEQHWQALPPNNVDDWRQGGHLAVARQDYPEAVQRWQRVLAEGGTVEDYYQAGMAAGSAGQREQQLAWLERAAQLAPEDPRIQADLGFALANSPEPAQRQAAIPVLEKAVRLRPDDYRLSAALATLQGSVGQVPQALGNWKHSIDLQSAIEPRDDNLSNDLFRARRAHQEHNDRTRWHFASTFAPRGVTSTADQRPSGLNAHQLDVDQRLSDDIGLQGGRLSAIGRVFSSGEHSNLTQTVGGAAGLRYTPWRDYNINLSGEVFHDDFAEGDTDFLLRASASLLDQGEYRNDWRPTEDDWAQRLLYLDAAWWVDESQRFLIARYSRGHLWKLDTSSAQAAGPYAMLQGSEQDQQQDLRAGLGLSWQLWFAEDHYNAYHNNLTLRVEYQWNLAGNLFDRRDGWMGGLELAF